MRDNYKDIPNFADEDEEREFWATHDSTEYIDWDSAQAIVLPKLRPSTFHQLSIAVGAEQLVGSVE